MDNYTLPDEPTTIAEYQLISRVRKLATHDPQAKVVIRTFDRKRAERRNTAADERTAERRKSGQTVATRMAEAKAAREAKEQNR